MTKEVLVDIWNQIKDQIEDGRRGSSIPNIKKLAATMRFLASGSYQRSVGQDFLISISQTAISDSITEVLCAVEKVLCPKNIKFPVTLIERKKKKTSRSDWLHAH